MAFRFVHAADIHLDSPLKSLALRDPELAALIGTATRRAFTAIVDLCLDEAVDALLLAGDLYDGEQTSMKTARFLAAEIRRLDQAGIRVFIIRGNHDALSKITKELVFPDSVKIFGGRAEVVEVQARGGGRRIAIHGISFAQPQAPESLLPKFKAPLAGATNIGMMHTSLTGADGHNPYAPCSPADLAAAGFRYWALGHIHKRLPFDPKAACVVVMPGMPQGRDINEAGPKTVTLVTVADDGTIDTEERLTGVAQFERVSPDLAGIRDWRSLVAAIGRAIEAKRAAARSEHLVVRLALGGTTPLAWQIRRDADLLRAEADGEASRLGRCSVEKIEIACVAPDFAGGRTVAADPLVELRRLIGQDILPSEGYRAKVAALADDLRGQLPRECLSLFGNDEAAAEAFLDAVVAAGAEDVLAQLQVRGDTEAAA